MNILRFIISDEHANTLDTVPEQKDMQKTIEALSLNVISQLMFKGNDHITVRYSFNDNRLLVHILKHEPAVDDGYISFGDYVVDKCSMLVRSMYLTRDLELARSAIETNE